MVIHRLEIPLHKRDLLNLKFPLIHQTHPHPTFDDLSDSEIIKKISEFFFNTFKKKVPTKKSITSNPLWNIDCSTVQATQRLQFSKFKRNPTWDNLVSKTKRDGWKSFCKDINLTISCQEKS